MPTLIFRELHCRHPKEIRDDEVYINLRTEDQSWIRRRSSDEGNPFWGPVTMEEGDPISFGHSSTSRDHRRPIEFQEFAHVELWEDDSPGRDDLIGSFTLRRNGPYGRDIHMWLPRGLYGPHHQSYVIIFDFFEEPLTEMRNRIELVSLTCNDPQGAKDQVELIINDERIWASWDRGGMRRGEQVTFPLPLPHYDFHDKITVVLSETQGQDWEDSFELIAGEYPLGPDAKTFTKDSGIVGDAEYTLQYRMSQVPG